MLRYGYRQGEFDIIEQVLKFHMPTLAANTTVILASGTEDELTARLYSNDDDQRLDCGALCAEFGGGGHAHRAGFGPLATDDPERLGAFTARVVAAFSE